MYILFWIMKSIRGKKVKTRKLNIPMTAEFGNPQQAGVRKLITYLRGGGTLKKIYLKKGVYCLERQVNRKREYVPMTPQPEQNEIAVVHRYYTKLKLDNNYKKRVTYLGEGGLRSKLAVIEYIGKFPGLSLHGNTKIGGEGEEYVRTPTYVMDEMKTMLETDKPSTVYNNLKRKYDELTRPTGLQQVRNKKRREKVKDTQSTNGNNVADQIMALENMVSKNHNFVRTIIRDKNKTPCIILYNDEQILDLKNICCSGQSVLGIDKTFNLCNMHVTVTCYKQLSVRRTRTEEPPIFLGPVLLHDSSDFESFGNFFYHLKMKLIDTDMHRLVIGTDDEKAMVKAIQSAFPESTHVLCSRHLKQNVIHKLTDDAVNKSDRNSIINKIFGTEGILDADDTICFDEKCEDFEQYCTDKSEKFLRYFQDRLKMQLKTKLNEPARHNKIDIDWTNNNSESINHVLKQSTDWKKKPLTELVSCIQEIVEGQFKDLRGAIIGTGEFRLSDTHKHFQVSKTEWVSKNNDQRNKLYQRFRKFVTKDKKYVTSTDGQSTVVAPKTLGKKPKQTVRRPKTVTIQKRTKIVVSSDEEN